jgi:hypothetical protein
VARAQTLVQSDSPEDLSLVETIHCQNRLLPEGMAVHGKLRVIESSFRQLLPEVEKHFMLTPGDVDAMTQWQLGDRRVFAIPHSASVKASSDREPRNLVDGFTALESLFEAIPDSYEKRELAIRLRQRIHDYYFSQIFATLGGDALDWMGDFQALVSNYARHIALDELYLLQWKGSLEHFELSPLKIKSRVDSAQLETSGLDILGRRFALLPESTRETLIPRISRLLQRLRQEQYAEAGRVAQLPNEPSAITLYDWHYVPEPGNGGDWVKLLPSPTAP